MMAVLTRLLLLFAGHALCDYPLQGDFLARGKNFSAPIPGVPWFWCMFAHSLIHAGMVFLVTRSLLLAAIELALHFAIDCGKCAGWFGFNTDQFLHYLLKACWAVL